ncbi:MAG: hypothetical protein KAV45_13610 [Calditrichia bacterium]|nr:hypothetical protein [Calditrichia bacterium]
MLEAEEKIMDDQYLKSVKEIEDLFKFMLKLSNDTDGRSVDTRREEVGSQIFTKICLHTASILRILPHSTYSKTDKKFQIWDYTSVAVLSRSIMDAYHVLYYLCIDDISNDELDFRFLVWDYHAESRRYKQLVLIGSQHEEVPKLEKEVINLKNEVKNHTFLNNLNKNTRKGVVRGEIPFILSNKEIAQSAGISEKFHEVSYMYLSSYIHTFPYSISQTSAIRKSEEILDLIKPIIDRCVGYLCLSIRDFISLVPDQRVYLVSSLQEKIDKWEDIFENLFI